MKPKRSSFSLMVGVSGSVPKPLPPLKPDKPTENNDVKGTVSTEALKPNSAGE